MEAFEIALPPEKGFDPDGPEKHVRQARGIDSADVPVRILRRSIDARGRQVKVRVRAAIGEVTSPQKPWSRDRLQPVHQKPEVLIIGSGPGGLFAALQLVEMGYKPVILEQGKDVRARRRDIAAINKDHIVNPQSNYCFGEGGAGTYSDGKLYTRSHKRGNVQRILEIFSAHGARPEILYDAHPHIGTNKLPRIIQEMRSSLLEAGAEIHFETPVKELWLQGDRVKGVVLTSGEKRESISVLLAAGHSARPLYQALWQQGVAMEVKPFALGIRAEHAQERIDRIQYHCDTRGAYLPAASYTLTEQVAERGVFSFCMCPGGFMVPSATQPGEVVLNGMSPSRRNSRFANSGIVVSVKTEDFQQAGYHGPLAGMRFQQHIEQQACERAGGSQRAPAQRMVDFVKGQLSQTLPECSYQPGLEPVNLHEVLPAPVAGALRQAFPKMGKKMKGYYTNDAVLVAVESRTSSPLRLPRNPDTLEHLQIEGLFPCGEGAGYAGGIVSAALDGERCARAIALHLNQKRNL